MNDWMPEFHECRLMYSPFGKTQQVFYWVHHVGKKPFVWKFHMVTQK